MVVMVGACEAPASVAGAAAAPAACAAASRGSSAPITPAAPAATMPPIRVRRLKFWSSMVLPPGLDFAARILHPTGSGRLGGQAGGPLFPVAAIERLHRHALHGAL